MAKMNKRMGEALAKRIAKLHNLPESELAYGPKFNDVFMGPEIPLVVWEEGPWEWALSEKLQDLAPKGWFVEAYNSFSVGLYKI